MGDDQERRYGGHLIQFLSLCRLAAGENGDK
jgi:hypothetical protein